MICFCGMVDRRKVCSLISSGYHCQRSSRVRRAAIWDLNLSSAIEEWSCGEVITTTPWHHFMLLKYIWKFLWKPKHSSLKQTQNIRFLAFCCILFLLLGLSESSHSFCLLAWPCRNYCVTEIRCFPYNL